MRKFDIELEPIRISIIDEIKQLIYDEEIEIYVFKMQPMIHTASGIAEVSSITDEMALNIAGQDGLEETIDMIDLFSEDLITLYEQLWEELMNFNSYSI